MSSRRHFLKNLSLSIGLSGFAQTHAHAYSPLLPLTQERKLRVALMGLGSYANRVAEAIKDCKKVELAGIITGTPSKVSIWKNKSNF